MAPQGLYVAVAALSTMALGASSVEAQCADPAAAVLKAMKCIENEDIECTEEAYYIPTFKKFHNQRDTQTSLTSLFGSFWGNAFKYTDFQLDFDLSQNTGVNEAEVRYLETVTTTSGEELGKEAKFVYPFAHAIKQYEHAIVTVNDDCKMTRWDQTGDDYEQGLVDTAVNDLLCGLKVLPFFLCFGSRDDSKRGELDATATSASDYTVAIGAGSAAGAALAVVGVAAIHYKSKSRVAVEQTLVAENSKFEL